MNARPFLFETICQRPYNEDFNFGFAMLFSSGRHYFWDQGLRALGEKVIMDLETMPGSPMMARSESPTAATKANIKRMENWKGDFDMRPDYPDDKKGGRE